MPINTETQLGGRPTSINEDFFDALVRHQIGLMRFNAGLKQRTWDLLNKTEADLRDRIIARLADRTGLDTPTKVKRMQSLVRLLQSTRSAAWDKVTELWVREAHALAGAEPEFVSNALKTVVPVVLETTLPEAARIKQIVDGRPFQGKTLREWAKDIRRADLRRIEDQIKIGMVQGETSRVIASRIVGTVRMRGRDGATETTRRQAEAITRTAVNAIGNQARSEFYQANSDIIEEELYVATLDNRTTMLCISLDGQRFPVGRGPHPPVHIRCRSLRVGLLDGVILGQRPAKSGVQKQFLREFTKREGLDPVASRDALPRGNKLKFDKFKRQRVRDLTGRVPTKVSYGEWLKRQTNEFQEDRLGKARARLFRDGNMPVDRFVDRKGDTITLSQLAKSDRDAFIAAGLNPEDFL